MGYTPISSTVRLTPFSFIFIDIVSKRYNSFIFINIVSGHESDIFSTFVFNNILLLSLVFGMFFF